MRPLKKKETPTKIESLKIIVRLLNEEDINKRQLPINITGVVITDIATDSPIINYMQVNDIIVEVQKTKIDNINQLKTLLLKNTTQEEYTLLFTIYNNQNQRRYIGIKIK